MPYIMGIDLGTSSVKALIMSENGTIESTCSKGYSIDIPEDGFAEQSPEVWWKASAEAIHGCIRKSGLCPEEIKCVGLSGQMHGTVIIDKKLQPIRPAIIHCDQRSTLQAQAIKQLLGEKYIKNVLLNPVFPGFQLVSLCWIREAEPYYFEKIYKVLLPKDYIRLKLTGEVATDYTDASATLAFDIRKREWCFETIDRLSINRSIFPECFEPAMAIGQITRSSAKITGLAPGTLVVAGASDQVMQSIGNGVIYPGTAAITIGTSGQVFFPTRFPVFNDKLNTHTFCGALPDSWYCMGAILNAGVCLNWFKNKVYGNTNEAFSSIDKEILDVKPGSGGVIFLPYLTGERTPHINPYARGMFFGLTLNTDYKKIYKSIMEGVAFALKECFETCMDLGLEAETLIVSGGGARSPIWLQMLADIFNRELYTTNITEHACVGASIVAGVGCGIYPTIEHGCKKVVGISKQPIMPVRKNVEIYSEYFQIYKQLYRINAPMFHAINEVL